MWILLNSGPISIVSHTELEGSVLARARERSHLEALVKHNPDLKIFEDVNADYRFRATVEKPVLAECLAEVIDAIDYPNFKNSVKDHTLHQLYSKVWGIFAGAYGAYVGKNLYNREQFSGDKWDWGLSPDDPEFDDSSYRKAIENACGYNSIE